MPKFCQSLEVFHIRVSFGTDVCRISLTTFVLFSFLGLSSVFFCCVICVPFVLTLVVTKE